MLTKSLKLNRYLKINKKMRFILTLFVLVFGLSLGVQEVNIKLFSSKLYAQSLASSMKLYFNGDLNGTESSLNKALKTNLSNKDKAQAYKYLGIVQYSKGRKDQASSNFKKSLAINPKMVIVASEVLDETVIPFFNSIKASMPKTAARSNQVGKSVNPVGVGGASTSSSRYSSKAKRTTLFVKSNVKSATVMIGGILAGSVNSVLDVSPGKQKIEVSSPGYITKRISVNVVVNNANSITADLSKPQPKVRQVATINQAPKAVKSPGGVPSSSQNLGAGTVSGYQEPGMALSQPSQQPQMSVNPYQQYTPSNQYIPNLYQTPIYTAPAPIYQYPAPLYTTPAPMYQAPIVQQPNYGYNDMLSYQQESSMGGNSSSSLVSPPSPPSSDDYLEDNYTDFNLDDSPSSSSSSEKKLKSKKKSKKKEELSYYFDDPGSKKSKKKGSSDDSFFFGSSKKSKKKSSSLGISAFLPLGIPQFMQGKYMWGIVFAGVQAGGLGYGIYNAMQYSDCAKNCQAEIDAFAESVGSDNQDLVQEYKDALEEQKNGWYTGQMVGYGVFAAGWIAGIIETFMNPPKVSKKSAFIIEKNTLRLLSEDDDKDFKDSKSYMLDEIAQESSLIEGIYSYKNPDSNFNLNENLDHQLNSSTSHELKILPTGFSWDMIPLVQYEYKF